ncbi:MAG: cation diffusion facilitator family transporter [Phycisphaerae bacterium]|nr:cation diffusion facilitator family transporter [Phycisphaerae bacterium]
MIHPITQQNNAAIRRVTYWGMLTNFGLAVSKSIVGLAVGSISLFADGIHSLSDLLTDVAVLVGVHFGSKEPDSEHPYGHGRLETFSTAFVAAILILVGCGMIYKASGDIAKMHAAGTGAVTISSWVIWIALLSVVSKEILYQWTRIVAVRVHSSVVYANAWHHRSDALSSIAVIIGAVAVKFGYPHGDQLGAIVVGIMIILVGIKVIDGCFREFSERAVDARTVEQIQKIIDSEERIRSWHKLRTRSVGREIFFDLHILVDPQLNITDAHEIAECLENTLHEQMAQPVNVMVHIEPDLPEMRK